MSKQKEQDVTNENDLVSYLEERVGHLKPYWSHIALGVCVVMLAIIASLYLAEQSRANEAAKWRDLSVARQNYRNTLNNQSFKDLAEQLPNEAPGLWALIEAADTEIRAGLAELATDRESGFAKIKRAQGFYRQVLDAGQVASTMLQQRATFGLAYACESGGEFDEAAELYKKLIELGDKDPLFQQSESGLARVSNPEIRNLFDKFKEYVPPTAEEAPGEIEGDSTEIDVSDVDKIQPNSGGGDFPVETTDAEADSDSTSAEAESQADESQDDGADSSLEDSSGQ